SSSAAVSPAGALLIAPKAKTRLAAERAKPIKERGLMKANREVYTVFIEVLFIFVERAPLSFAVTLREEGQVALLESPNGLGATRRISITRRTVKNEISCDSLPFAA